jgi:hypothetical protein
VLPEPARATLRQHQPHVQPAAQLAAWIVTKLPDCNLYVSYKVRPGCKCTLRAGGVPATVTLRSATELRVPVLARGDRPDRQATYHRY